MVRKSVRVAMAAVLFLGLPLGVFAQDESSGSVDTVRRVIADEVVAIVGFNHILFSDVEKMAAKVLAERKAQGTLATSSEREAAFEMLLAQNLMAACAKLDSLDKDMSPVDDLVEREVARMIESAGGMAALERSAGKPIYQIKTEITVNYKHMQLAQVMESHIRSGVKVNYKEVADFIDSLDSDLMQTIPIQYSYSQIIKLPPQTDERKYAIREQLLEYRKRVMDKDISFGALAQLYSADRETARRRGEMGPMPVTQFVGPFASTAEALNPGEVSEIVETEYGYHIIELISKEDRKGVTFVHLRHILLKPEFTVEESRNVITQLDSIAGAVRDNKLTFGEAAMRFSNDVASVQNGGKAFNSMGYLQTGDIRATSSRFVAEEMQPADYRVISSLEIGGISDPYETLDAKGNLVQKIVRLDGITAAHTANVIDDYDLLQAVAIAAKEGVEIDKWIDDNMERVYIEIKPEYLEMNFEKNGWKVAAQRSYEGRNLKVKLPDYDTLMERARIRIKKEADSIATLRVVAKVEPTTASQTATQAPLEEPKEQKEEPKTDPKTDPKEEKKGKRGRRDGGANLNRDEK